MFKKELFVNNILKYNGLQQERQPIETTCADSQGSMQLRNTKWLPILFLAIPNYGHVHGTHAYSQLAESETPAC